MNQFPDPTYPLSFLGEVVSSHWAAGNRSLDIVVVYNYKRRRFARAVPLTNGATTQSSAWVNERSLFHVLLVEAMLEPFIPVLGQDLTGKPIVLKGVPTGGVDAPEGHLIHVRNAEAFIPTHEWLVEFGAAPTEPVTV